LSGVKRVKLWVDNDPKQLREKERERRKKTGGLKMQPNSDVLGLLGGRLTLRVGGFLM
jgi:hypothetical protein